MSWTSLFRPAGVAVVSLVILAGCSSTSPNGHDLTEFVSGVQGFDGTTAVQTRSGSPPAASGGPTLTATTQSNSSSATVNNGGSTLVHLRGTSPFTQVFVSVIDDPLDGFYTLTLPSATTDTLVVVQLGRTIPENTFQSIFSVKDPGGKVSASQSIANTVTNSATGSVQVTVSWDQPQVLVDLHVIDPLNGEVDWLTPNVDGGTLDLIPICFNPNGNIENIVWPTNAPTGTYTVRVDYFDTCGGAVTTNYVVTVRNGSSTSLFTGTFTGFGDGGGHGSGRLITTFNHTASSLTTQEVPPMITVPNVLSREQLAERVRARTSR